MSKTLTFDEQDPLAAVVQKYRTACTQLGVEEAARTAGEDLIRSFHRDLAQSAHLGTGARLEKTIGGCRGSLRVIGITRLQRSRIGRLLSQLFR
jgi:hypothetical protein